MPRDTTPTWEIELLISGALVFSLLQLPDALDALHERQEPRLSTNWSTILFLGYVYIKAAALALVGTFIAHLATRGYWVAVVGLRSVYPHGVRWDELRHGPSYLAEARASTPTLTQLIDRADNLASLIFAFGMLLVLMTLVSVLYLVPTLAITLLLAWIMGLGTNWHSLFWGVFAAMLAPLVIAYTLDATLGRRLKPGHWLQRALRWFYRGYSRLLPSRLTNGMMLTFTSNVGRHRGVIMLVLSLWAVVAVVLFSALMARGVVAIDNYEFVPRALGEHMLDDRHYASMRRETRRYSTLPFIQSDVVTEPYVRLFIPYDPNRHGHAIRTRCPEVGTRPGRDAEAMLHGAWRRAVLDCVARVQPVTLDGSALALDLDFATDPISDLRGVVAHIPARALAPGRHEIVVTKLALPPEDPRASAKPEQPYRIPFWR